MQKITLILLICLQLLYITQSLECELNCSDDGLKKCLKKLNPSDTEFILTKGYYYCRQKINPLAKYLPNNPQLTHISIELGEVKSFQPLEVCFQGLTNLKTFELNLNSASSTESEGNLNFLVPMLSDQSKSLENLNLNILNSGYYTNILPVNYLLSGLANLKNADLQIGQNYRQCSLGGLQDLFKKNQNLENLSLTIRRNRDQMDFQDIQGLQNVFNKVNSLKTLKLDLKSCVIGNANDLQDTFTPISSSLEELNLILKGNFIDYSPFQQIFRKMINLETLTFDISNNNQFDDKAYFKSLQNIFVDLPTIQTINFKNDHCSLENFKFKYFQNMFSCPTLKKLDFNMNSGQGIKYDGLEFLADGLQQIQDLKLNFSLRPIKDQYMEDFKQFLQKLPQIQKLDLDIYGTQIEDITQISQGLESLIELNYIKLNMGHNTIKSINSLSTAFLQANQLDTFIGDFSHNCLVKERDYKEEFQRIYPNVQKVKINQEDQFFSQSCLNMKKQQIE